MRSITRKGREDGKKEMGQLSIVVETELGHVALSEWIRKFSNGKQCLIRLSESDQCLIRL